MNPALIEAIEAALLAMERVPPINRDPEFNVAIGRLRYHSRTLAAAIERENERAIIHAKVA